MLPLPEPLLGSRAIGEAFEGPRGRDYPYTESYEWGGVDFADPSEGLISHTWRAWTNGRKIWCQREGSAVVRELVNDIAITEVDLTFDQNMQPCLVYKTGEDVKLIWYNSQLDKFVTTQFENLHYPRVSLDDKRPFNIANSDIIFAYIRAESLYYRIQRERYSVEHLLLDRVGSNELIKIGMSENLRFLFHVFP